MVSWMGEELNIDDVRMMFLCCCQKTSADQYFGGGLVTNHIGLPLEFRCSAPVAPTVGQRVLYGTTIEPHIKVDLIGGTLVDAVAENPHLIISDEEVLLDLQRKIDIPVVWLRREEAITAVEPMDNLDTLSPTGGYQPVVVTVHPSYTDDLADVMLLLKTLSDTVDLIEPFARIHEALKEAEDQLAS